MYTASFAFFEALFEGGVSHCFVNLGSDHPSILEAMVKGQRETPDHFPKIITCPNEMVALSCAHGMALVTGRPQAVIVHVDVGTQGLGAAVHNASCGRAPVLIFAGLSPFTQDGEMRGSRTEFIHYIQDVSDQKQIVAQYCRYTGEIKTGKNVKQMIHRALSFAMSDPKGPVYVYGAREVMEEDIEPYKIDITVWDPISPCALTENAVKSIGDALITAESPLVLTGYVGRTHEAVPELVKLADTIPIQVLDTIGSDMNFPADHKAYLGTRYGVHEKIKTADVILVLDNDVPWIPTQCKPSKTAKIFHIDVDPLKQQMPVFYIPAKSRHKADATTALKQLNAYIESQSVNIDTGKFDIVSKESKERIDQLIMDSKPREDGKISCAYLVRSVREAIPEDSVILVEAVTNTVTVLDQLQSKIPGAVLNCGAGGLGWFGGASLGVKLGLDHIGKPRFVAAIVGDGTFLFTVPASVYWISRRYNIPFLTVVLNNTGWRAPLRSAKLVHPDGYSASATYEELNISFNPTPDYAGIAKAAAGGEIWGGTAKTMNDIGPLLKEAVETVKGGRSAVLDVFIEGFNP